VDLPGEPSKQPESAKQPQAQTPLVGNSKWMELLTEGTKLTVLAAFILYALGFIIWHSYLAKYGAAPVEFLRSEYFSAALCYVAMVITFGFPVVVLFKRFEDYLRRVPKTNTSTFDFVAFGWYAMATQFISSFLPPQSHSK